MRIELYRHGMTEGNKVGRYVGQRDEPLCEEGIAELSCLDADERIVYTSPRIRCVQTARILFPNAHVERVADLDEMSFGAFEGRTWREMQEDPVFREWIDGDCVGRCPGGEDQAEHHARVAAVFVPIVDEALATGTPRLRFVVHSYTIMAILGMYGDQERDHWGWRTSHGAHWETETDEALWGHRTLHILNQPQAIDH